MYRKPPWAIYKKGDSWIYTGISPTPGDESIHLVAVFSHDHTRDRIYNDQTRENSFIKCDLHSSGVILDGNGLLFVGHSDAGKSTIATMLRDIVEILCDDRMIIRKRTDGFRIYGTWSHGDVPDVSPSSAPLKAIMFLEQAPENRLIPVDDRKEIIRRLLACLIKPFETTDWWAKSLRLVERMAREVPCYVLKFDKSGAVVDVVMDEFMSW